MTRLNNIESLTDEFVRIAVVELDPSGRVGHNVAGEHVLRWPAVRNVRIVGPLVGVESG